jgi:hypothetical protein
MYAKLGWMIFCSVFAHWKHRYQAIGYLLILQREISFLDTHYPISACTLPAFQYPSEAWNRISHLKMSKSAPQRSTPAMDPPPPYDASPTASPRNSSDSMQLGEAEAEAEPLTSGAPATVDSSDSQARENPIQRSQHYEGCCNIMSESGCCNIYAKGGCCNIYSTDGCCNFESTGGCCNYR